MGSYANATVFAQEPDWKAFEQLPFAITAYRHRRKPVWVVAVFEPGARRKQGVVFAERAPVIWAMEDATQRALSSEVRTVLDRLAIVQKTTGRFSGPLADYLAYLSFAAEMARRAGTPAYFFAANDEGLDIGCYVSSPRFERFAFECDHFVVDYDDGTISLAQRDDFEDDDEVDVDALAERLRHCAEIKDVVLRPLTKEDRRRVDYLYGFAAAIFPKEMMAAKTALNIGKADMFDNVDKDLQVVSERTAGDKSPLKICGLEKMTARPRTVKPEKVDLGRGKPEFCHRDGDMLVFRTIIKLPETLFADVSSWPPKLNRLDERVWSVDRSRGGRWVMLTVFREDIIQVGHHQVSRHEVRLRDEPFSTYFSTLACGGPNPELGVQWVGFLGDRVVAEPYGRGGAIERCPLLQAGDTLVPVEGASKVKSICPPYVVRLTDGSDVLLWGNGGYELRAGRLVKTFDLGPNPVAGLAVPWGDDAFFFAEYGKLFEARRGQPPRRHVPWLENLSTVTAGPPGALLLHGYYRTNKELGLIYFPDDGTFIRLEFAHVKEEKPENLRSLYWLPSCDRLLIVAEARLWSLPGEFVMSLPRRTSEGKK